MSALGQKQTYAVHVVMCRRAILARRYGTLLLDRLPRRSRYRLRRRLQDWPVMRRPSDRQQTPH